MKKFEMLLAGDAVDPERSRKLLDESSKCMLPDDRVDLKPLNLSTSLNQSTATKPSLFNCCSSDSSLRKDISMQSAPGKSLVKPIAITPEKPADRQPVLKSEKHQRHNTSAVSSGVSPSEQQDIEERVSARLTAEFRTLQKEKEREFLTEIKKQRAWH
jgi:hypothetical protein